MFGADRPPEQVGFFAWISATTNAKRQNRINTSMLMEEVFEELGMEVREHGPASTT